MNNIINKMTIGKRFILSVGLIILTFMLLLYFFFAYYKDVSSYQELEKQNSESFKNSMTDILKINSESIKAFDEMQKNSQQVADLFDVLMVVGILNQQLNSLSANINDKEKVNRVVKAINDWLSKPAANHGLIKGLASQIKPLLTQLKNEPDVGTVSDIQDVIVEIMTTILEFSLDKGNYSMQAMATLNTKINSVNTSVQTNIKNLEASDKKREANVQKGKSIIAYIVISIIATILFMAFLLYVLKLFSGDIKKLTESLSKVTRREGELDFSSKISYNKESKDEIAFIAKATEKVFDSVKSVLSEVKEGAKENLNSSKQLENTAKNLSDNIDKQTTLIDDVNILAQDVGQNLDKTEEMAIHTTEDLHDTQEVLLEFVKNIEHVIVLVANSSEKQVEIAEKMKGLTDQANQIKDVLKIISDIAERTNLLALNAAIEAARAGEHGRGFAVVADNVRQLAEMTQKSLAEINSTVNVILQGINDNSDEISNISSDITLVSSKAQELITQANETKNRLANTISISSEVVHMDTYIAKKTKDLMDIMRRIIELSTNNKSAGANVLNVALLLAEKTKELEVELEKFRS